MGTIYEYGDGISKYWNLSDYADSLARANANLYADLDYSKFSHAIWRDSIKDEDIQQHYTYIEAKIINNSTNRHNNSLTLNRGRKHELTPGMGVIGNKGIIGIVKNVSENFSRVMSILHRESKISVAIKRNNYFGSLIWEGSNPKFINLDAVPKHADLMIGDTIQTSSYSSIFPEGIMVGKIDTFWLEPGSNFYKINVELINDLNNVKFGYVVNNLLKGEKEALEEEVDE